MGAPIATLRDDFEDNAIAACWETVIGGSATAAETSGQARLTLPSSTAGSHLAYYRTPASQTYDLTGGAFSVTITTMVSTAVAATATFDVFIFGGDIYRWIQLSNTIKVQTVLGGVTTDRFSATWSSSTYKYLRIRESGGAIFFDSSTNGTSWTNRYTAALAFDVSAIAIQFGASCGNVASPGSLRLDDVNLILPALATTWNWDQVVWPLSNRYRVVTMACDAAGTAQACVVTADGVDASNNPSGNVRYWAGPASAGRVLTEQASLAAAQAMAVDIPLDGRFDLPTLVEARCIRVYHRSIDGNPYTMRELYPRRLVQGDDVEAETLSALHIRVASLTGDRIVAGTITADLLSVAQLSAIAADMGDLTAGRITGAIIRTAASGARVELNSFGTGGGLIGYAAGDTYDVNFGTGTYQVLWKKADGKLYAGGGVVLLDTNGIGITGPTFSYNLYNASPVTLPRSNMLQWSKTSGTTAAAIVGSASAQLLLLADKIVLAIPLNASDNYGLSLLSNGAHALAAASFAINAGGLTAPDCFSVTTAFSAASSHVDIAGGLNVGSVSGASGGDIKAAGVVQPGGVAVSYDANLLTIANNGVAALGMSNFGKVMIHAGGVYGEFAINGGSHTTTELLDPSGVFSAVAGTANSWNVYWSAGNSRYEIENKRGSTLTARIWLLDAA